MKQRFLKLLKCIFVKMIFDSKIMRKSIKKSSFAILPHLHVSKNIKYTPPIQGKDSFVNRKKSS